MSTTSLFLSEHITLSLGYSSSVWHQLWKTSTFQLGGAFSSHFCMRRSCSKFHLILEDALNEICIPMRAGFCPGGRVSAVRLQAQPSVVNGMATKYRSPAAIIVHKKPCWVLGMHTYQRTHTHIHDYTPRSQTFWHDPPGICDTWDCTGHANKWKNCPLRSSASYFDGPFRLIQNAMNMRRGYRSSVPC